MMSSLQTMQSSLLGEDVNLTMKHESGVFKCTSELKPFERELGDKKPVRHQT